MAQTDNPNVAEPATDNAAADDFSPWDGEPDSAVEIDQAKLAELEARLSAEPEAWMPEGGEVLSGTVVGVETRRSDYGPYPAIVVQRLDGTELVFHAFRTVALNEVLRQKPRPGDLIAILYTGKVQGTDYHGYRIKLGGVRESDFDWSQFSEKKRPQ